MGFLVKKIYCDLDGVLADFEQGVKNLMGVYPHETKDHYMWPAIQKHGNFFGSLPWMEDGRDLWAYILPHNPTILTARPRSIKVAENNKLAWCNRHLGPEIPVIITSTDEKWYESAPGHILIDDRLRNKKTWEDQGGYFIHHTSTEESIEELIEVGVT